MPAGSTAAPAGSFVRRLRVTDVERVKTLLCSESERSPEGTFLHRLHCVALVAAGFGCNEVAAAFGDDRRSVQRWVHRFEQAGGDGLTNSPRLGRPTRLTQAQLDELRPALAQPPQTLGHAADAWSAELLRQEVERRFGIAYSRRHCVRLLGQLRQPAGRASSSTSGNDTAATARR
jgi:transposase